MMNYCTDPRGVTYCAPPNQQKPEKSYIEQLKLAIDGLTDEQRLELFSHYCTHCGCDDPRCQCWNDE